MKYFRDPTISLTAQLAALRRLYPEGRGAVARDRLMWEQRIRPHPLCHDYLCRLEYSLREFPRCCVIDPQLTSLAGGRVLPHVRSIDEPISMCLFVYESGCWNSGMLLGKVVVPMAFFWLACFEDWLFSGEWRGGGTHPITPCPPSSAPVFPADLLLRNAA